MRSMWLALCVVALAGMAANACDDAGGDGDSDADTDVDTDVDRKSVV